MASSHEDGQERVLIGVPPSGLKASFTTCFESWNSSILTWNGVLTWFLHPTRVFHLLEYSTLRQRHHPNKNLKFSQPKVTKTLSSISPPAGPNTQKATSLAHQNCAPSCRQATRGLVNWFRCNGDFQPLPVCAFRGPYGGVGKKKNTISISSTVCVFKQQQ